MADSKKNLIVAIDNPNIEEVKSIVSLYKDQVAAVKLGLEFFVANGAEGVREIKKLGADIFLDLKLHDIPNTVAAAIREVTKIGVKMITIHSSGGLDMMRLAKKTSFETALKSGVRPPLVLGVTILTSLDQNDINEIGYGFSVDKQVIRLARLAEKAGLDGIVCSSFEIEKIKSQFSKLKLIVPGIRFAGDDLSEQKRVMTPKDALTKGADYLVMGRSITGIDKIKLFNDQVR